MLSFLTLGESRVMVPARRTFLNAAVLSGAAVALLGIPEATVRTRFFRARGLLREALARDVDTTLEDAFAFDGDRCNRLVAAVLKSLAAPVAPAT